MDPLSPHECMAKITGLSYKLATAIDEYEKTMRDIATKEEAYNVILASRILTLKAEGQPATLIALLAKGDRTVAKAKLDLAVAEAMAAGAKERVRGINTDINAYQSILSYHKEADKLEARIGT